MIAEAAGLEAALAIAKAHGGCRVYVPKPDWLEKGNSGWLVDLLGRESAIRVAECYGGENIVLPMGPSRRSALNYFRVEDARRRGLTTNAIARELGVGRRTVFYYVAEIRREESEARKERKTSP